MKTLKIPDLKKEILVVELERLEYYEIFKHGIYIKDHANAEREFIEGNYTLLGKIDEIKDEDLDGIVSDFDAFQSTGEGTGFYDYIKSFNSALEKHLFWVNPYQDDWDELCEWGYVSIDGMTQMKSDRYNQAQEKTFDRKKTLIFVKN